jgi:hypothetical protein
MSSSNYQYITDAGVLYQCTLPDDFAIALSLSPATGTEPYLPPEISPRFVSYRCNSPLLFREAVLGTVTQYNHAPFVLSVGGYVYNYIGNHAESIAPITNLAFNFGPQGITGPPGPTGPTGPTGPAGGAISIASNTILGNNTGSTAAAFALTPVQVAAMLPALNATGKGLAPLTNTPSGKYLRDDNVWAAPFKIYQSNAQGPLTTSTTFAFALGLALPPNVVQVWLLCSIANNGYAVGDAVPLPAATNWALYFDATQVYVVTGTVFTITIPNKSTRVATALTLADWGLYVCNFGLG